MQDSNTRSLEPNIQQTECPLINRLSYRWSSSKLELDSPPLWSASIQPTRPYCRLVLTLALPIYMSVVIDFDALTQASDFRINTCLLLLISMLWHRQVIFDSKGDTFSSSTECRIRTRVSGNESPADWKMIRVATLVQFYQFGGEPNTFPCR